MNWIRQQHNKQQQIRSIKVTTAEVVSEKENFFSDRRRSFSSFILLSFVLSVFSRFSRLKVICWLFVVVFLFQFLVSYRENTLFYRQSVQMLFIPLLPLPFSGFPLVFLSSCLRSRSCSLKYKSKEKRREKYWKKTTDSSSVFVIQPTHRMKLEKEARRKRVGETKPWWQ